MADAKGEPPEKQRFTYWAECDEKLPNGLWDAWWGKEPKVTSISPSGNLKDDEMDVDDSSPPKLEKISIDHALDNKEPMGDILLREEYTIALNLIKNRAEKYAAKRTPSCGLVITGQPGIGKTYFLWYLLRHRLHQQAPTMFSLGNKIYFFHESGVYVPGIAFGAPGRNQLPNEAASTCAREKGETVWSLIDRKTLMSEPEEILWEGGVFPIQTASPNPVRFEAWRKENMARRYIMNPWEWHEIVAGFGLQPVIQGSSLLDAADTKSRLREAFDRYGPVPRNVYLAIVENGLPEYDEKTTELISRMAFDQLQSLVSGIDSPLFLQTSNKIICLRRPTLPAHGGHLSSLEERRGSARTSDGFTVYEEFRHVASTLSPYVLRALVTQSTFTSLDDKRRLCQLFAGIPQLGSARGAIFESYMHCLISAADRPSFLVYQLARSTNGRYKPSGQGSQESFIGISAREPYVYNSVAEFKGKLPQPTKYNIPVASNNPCFDSFMVTQSKAIIYQMSVSKEHRVDVESEKGLALLKQILPPQTQHFKWIYVLVVPDMNVEAVALTHVSEKWERAVDEFKLMISDLKVPEADQ